MTLKERQTMLLSLREQYHKSCPVCGTRNPNGLRVAFTVCADGTVEAEVICGEDKEGYDGHLHGGIIASLLDGAMTNCLFSLGIPAVTGELLVRMVHPLQTGTKIVVRAWLDHKRLPIYLMKAELRQDGRLAAKSRAKFMQKTLQGSYRPRAVPPTFNA